MGQGRRLRVVFLSMLVALPGAPASGSGLYKFVDANGVVHFTDAPADPRFRKTALPKSRILVNYYPSPRSEAARTRAARARSAPSTPDEYAPLIEELAQTHGVPAALVKAVVAAESRFDPNARSSKGAQGLMQLMPGTADMLGVEDPFEPRHNVDGGVRYLRQLLDRFGDPIWAVAAYNAGPEAVDRHGGIPPYPETREYVRRVMSYYRTYDGDLLR